MTEPQQTDSPAPGRVQRRAEGLVAEYIHELSPHAADEVPVGDESADTSDG